MQDTGYPTSTRDDRDLAVYEQVSVAAREVRMGDTLVIGDYTAPHPVDWVEVFGGSVLIGYGNHARAHYAAQTVTVLRKPRPVADLGHRRAVLAELAAAVAEHDAAMHAWIAAHNAEHGVWEEHRVRVVRAELVLAHAYSKAARLYRPGSPTATAMHKAAYALDYAVHMSKHSDRVRAAESEPAVPLAEALAPYTARTDARRAARKAVVLA